MELARAPTPQYEVSHVLHMRITDQRRSQSLGGRGPNETRMSAPYNYGGEKALTACQRPSAQIRPCAAVIRNCIASFVSLVDLLRAKCPHARRVKLLQRFIDLISCQPRDLPSPEPAPQTCVIQRSSVSTIDTGPCHQSGHLQTHGSRPYQRRDFGNWKGVGKTLYSLGPPCSHIWFHKRQGGRPQKRISEYR